MASQNKFARAEVAPSVILDCANHPFFLVPTEKLRLPRNFVGERTCAKQEICLIAITTALATQTLPASAAIAQWDRTVLPRPAEPYQGVANRTLEGSKASFTEPVKAPPGAPNILLVLIDDAGFGNSSTFGGPIATPTLDKLAAEGLRYNRFHVTALCSPTRAALLAGRNHHAVGFGSISELIGGWPGYNTNWPKSAASIARILQGNGYSTATFGKWHLTPDDQQGPAGPFDRWPNALGFDYFWGFLGGYQENADHAVGACRASD
jgi:Sulfatase